MQDQVLSRLIGTDQVETLKIMLVSCQKNPTPSL